jgi:hypothetical protein
MIGVKSDTRISVSRINKPKIASRFLDSLIHASRHNELDTGSVSDD